MGRIFISCSSKDSAAALTICDAIEARGYACWLASRDVEPGQNFQVEIVKAIRAAPLMVLVFSGNANNSNEIKKEIAVASQYNLTVIPLRIEDVAPSEAFIYELATRQWIDMFGDWERAMNTLTRHIASALPREETPVRPAEPAAPVVAEKAPQEHRPLTPVAESPPAGWKQPKVLGAIAAAVILLLGGAYFVMGRGPQPAPLPSSQSRQQVATAVPSLFDPKVQQAVDAARLAQKQAQAAADKGSGNLTKGIDAANSHWQPHATSLYAAGYGDVTIVSDGRIWDWTGQVTNGAPDGLGELSIEGTSFDGEMRNGRGFGLLMQKQTNEPYAGEVHDGMREGLGIDIGVGRGRKSGHWSADKLNGFAVVSDQNGNQSLGMFKDDKLNGYGAKLDAKGKPLEQGLYRNGVLVTSLSPKL